MRHLEIDFHSHIFCKKLTWTVQNFLVTSLNFMPKTQCLKSQERSHLTFGQFAIYWTLEVFGKTVLPDMLIFIGQKFVENTKIQKFKMWHFGWFSNTLLTVEARTWPGWPIRSTPQFFIGIKQQLSGTLFWLWNGSIFIQKE